MKRIIINQIVQEKLRKRPNHRLIQKLQQLLDQEIDDLSDMPERQA